MFAAINWDTTDSRVMGRHPAPAAPADYLTDWFDTFTKPLIVVTADELTVLETNRAAEGLFRQDGGMRLKHGRLEISAPGGAERVRAHLAEPGEDIAPCALQERETGQWLILDFKRLSGGAPSPLILITVHRSESGPGHRWADLGSIFGLTPAEVRVATTLTGPETVDETARKFGITVETARTHIRRIYSKVGVGSREELTATLLPFRLD